MINSQLLRDSILDAKAVRATALANARASLEEAFAPRFEAMFAEKLKEDTAEEDEEEQQQEENLKEVEAPNQVDGSGGEAKAPKTKAVTKGNPKTPKSASGDKDFKPVKAGVGPSDVANFSKKVNEAAEEEEEEESKKEMDETTQQTDEAGLTSEDLDEIIKELENEVSDENVVDDGNPKKQQQFPPSNGGNGDDIEQSGGEDDDINAPVNTGGEESDVVAEPGSDVNINLNGDNDNNNVEDPEGMNAGGLEGGDTTDGEVKDDDSSSSSNEFPPQQKKFGNKEVNDNNDEEINLDELLSALNEEAEEEEEEEESKKEEMDETTIKNNGVPKNVGGQDKKGGVKGYPTKTSNDRIEASGKNHNIQGKGNIGGHGGPGTGKPIAEIVQYKTALKESYKTIEFLRGQINEVNLLNAKLLYTNKLFKEFGGVLDDSYRMKIVESFDLTKSVREVKLAYAFLAESLNFGTQLSKTHQKVGSQINNSGTNNTTKSQIKQITEGFSSKQVASTRPSSQLINEGSSEMVLRFHKLAGIKEDPKKINKK